jgi:hypothetical protein
MPLGSRCVRRCHEGTEQVRNNEMVRIYLGAIMTAKLEVEDHTITEPTYPFGISRREPRRVCLSVGQTGLVKRRRLRPLWEPSKTRDHPYNNEVSWFFEIARCKGYYVNERLIFPILPYGNP